MDNIEISRRWFLDIWIIYACRRRTSETVLHNFALRVSSILMNLISLRFCFLKVTLRAKLFMEDRRNRIKESRVILGKTRSYGGQKWVSNIYNPSQQISNIYKYWDFEVFVKVEPCLSIVESSTDIVPSTLAVLKFLKSLKMPSHTTIDEHIVFKVVVTFALGS